MAAGATHLTDPTHLASPTYPTHPPYLVPVARYPWRARTS